MRSLLSIGMNKWFLGRDNRHVSTVNDFNWEKIVGYLKNSDLKDDWNGMNIINQEIWLDNTFQG
jgi:hypothetical protein